MTFFSPVIKQNSPTNVCLTRTKQISSELVCGSSFVKILCTYFFLYKFGSLAANVPAWEHSCILESVDQIELKFCKDLLFANSSKCKKFQRNWKRFSCTGGKKVNHSPNINRVNSQILGKFCKADLIIVHCRNDKLPPPPLGQLHCRPPACKLFFCGPSVLQVLKNFVNRVFGHSQLLEGFESGICAKRIIN